MDLQRKRVPGTSVGRREVLNKGFENRLNRRRRLGLDGFHFTENIRAIGPTLKRHKYRARRASFKSDDDFEESEVAVDMSYAPKRRSGIEEALVGLVWWCLNPNGVAIVSRDERWRRRR